MKLALDTNILAYAEGVNDEQRQNQALDLIQRLPPESTYLPVQVLGELYSVLVRKAQRPREQAALSVLSWKDAFRCIDTSAAIMAGATDLAVDHQFMIWDAVIMTAAADAGCRLLLSEDLHDGFTWQGVSVVNPFASEPNPLLEAALIAAE